MRLPVHVVEDLHRVSRIRRELVRELGREPEIEELAKELGEDPDHVEELLTWGRDPLSLDTPVGDDEATRLGDLVQEIEQPTPEDIVLAGLHDRRVHAMVDRLDPRSAEIVRYRYGMAGGREHSLAEIAGRAMLCASPAVTGSARRSSRMRLRARTRPVRSSCTR